MREASEGIRVKATTSEMVSEKQMVITMSRKSMPAMPGTKSTGMKTTRVVRVEAVTAMPTSCAPLLAASRSFSFCSSWRRKMLSRTTIELSTSMPIESANPAMEMMFSVNPA
ncbi:MAG: hypothetical protein BWY83_00954 [bacterium ADurb.Bin478]|nr:MAG: hypothetical protein BWY83_00954 [bacterium ADurb.Bin478]